MYDSSQLESFKSEEVMEQEDSNKRMVTSASEEFEQLYKVSLKLGFELRN